MVAEVLILTALKEPVKKIANLIFDGVSKRLDEREIESSLHNLSEKIYSVIMVKTFYQINQSIDLHDFYVPTRIKNVSSVINNIGSIDSNSIVLEGTVGQGKSIFMRYLTYQEAIKGEKVPIFYELRRLTEQQTLESAITTAISNWIPLFKKDNFTSVADSGQLVLFLDGFDEVPQENVNRLINEIEGWRERYPEMQIVISTRPEAEIQKSNYFKIYQLAEYTFPEQKELVKKLMSDEEFQENLIKSIEDSSLEIKELLKTPLMVTLFVKQYEVSLQIPKNHSEFYENLFANLASLHDNTKAGFDREINSSLDISKLQEVFEEFCFVTGNSEKLVLTRKETIDIIKKCTENQDIDVDSNKILKDFSTVVCLLLKDGLEYTFIHRSIQEYFYSSFILGKSFIAKEVFYNKVLSGKNYHMKLHNVIEFLKESDTYSYYKYLEIPLIDEYIRVLNITRESNKMLDSLYVDTKDEKMLHFRLVNNNFVNVNTFNMPEAINELFIFISNHYQNSERSISFGIFKLLDSNENLIKVKGFEDNLISDLLENKMLVVGEKLLLHREKMNEYISKSDGIDFLI